MDFFTILFLIIPLISLYVRTPLELVSQGRAIHLLLLICGTSALYLAAGLALFGFHLKRSLRKGGLAGEAFVSLGRANNLFICGLTALFFMHVHVLLLKESFESLFFPSSFFLVSDALLLLPFLVPFVLFRTLVGRAAMSLKGRPVPFGREVRRQLRTLAVLVFPQLLYLNLYRVIVVDLPGFSDWFAVHPMSSFVVAATLLFLLFVFSPYFIRLLFDRVPLAEVPGGEALLGHLRQLSDSTGIALDRVFVWLTRERRVANAAVSGLFRRQRTVFLTDHLLRSLPVQEVVAVVAHELGHTRLGHLFLNFLLAITSGVFVIWGLVLLLLMIGGENESQLGLAAAVVALEVAYIMLVFGSAARRFERQADLFAACVTGSVQTVASALLRLAEVNHVSVRRASITHPSIRSRVRRLEALAARHGDHLEPALSRARRGNLWLAVAMLAALGLTAAAVEWLPI